MPQPEAEPRITLPDDPLLRVLVLYGVAALIALLLLRVALAALGLPAWLWAGAVSLLVLGAPVVALGTWLALRRR